MFKLFSGLLQGKEDFGVKRLSCFVEIKDSDSVLAY